MSQIYSQRKGFFGLLVGIFFQECHSNNQTYNLVEMDGYQTDGGLIDGPVYGSIANSLIGVKLHDEDEYAQFGQRNLYKKAINAKNAHNLFAKLRLHF